MAGISERMRRRGGGRGPARSRGPAAAVPGEASRVEQPVAPRAVEDPAPTRAMEAPPRAGVMEERAPARVVEEPAASRVVEEPVRGSGAVPPTGLLTAGILLLLLGAWAGICVFVGPTFGYHPAGQRAWQWNQEHALLWAAPGAAAFLAGLVLIGSVRRASAGYGRGGVHLAALLAVLAGGWLLVGPTAWPVVHPGAVVFATAGGWTRFLQEVGANLGVGGLIVAFGAYAGGLAGQSRRATRMLA